MCSTLCQETQTCAANQPARIRSGQPRRVLLPSAYIGNLVPGSGSQTNGMIADGYPGMRPGEYFKLHSIRRGAACRVSPGTSTGTASRRCARPPAFSTRYRHAGPGKGYVGTPPAAFNRTVRYATFADIENFATSGKTFVETPFTSQYAGGETRSLEKSYNLNVAYQRDVGFSTTAEVAYVGSWTYAGDAPRTSTARSTTCICLRIPAGCSTATGWPLTCCGPTFPGMGAINQWRDASDGYTTNNNTLRYNAMQLNVQRRLSRGLQMGLAYTLAKGVGWTGFNPDYLDADPTGELNKLRLWGPTANDRTHNLVINYSYMIPNRDADCARAEVDPRTTGWCPASRST